MFAVAALGSFQPNQPSRTSGRNNCVVVIVLDAEKRLGIRERQRLSRRCGQENADMTCLSLLRN